MSKSLGKYFVVLLWSSKKDWEVEPRLVQRAWVRQDYETAWHVFEWYTCHHGPVYKRYGVGIAVYNNEGILANHAGKILPLPEDYKNL
jgi:hypothetical protein